VYLLVVAWQVEHAQTVLYIGTQIFLGFYRRLIYNNKATLACRYTDNSFLAGGTIGEVLLFDGPMDTVSVEFASALLLTKWASIWKPAVVAI
jgi:hypothetical protein